MLREVREEDLPVFFEHHSAPEALRMAGFPAQDRDTFISRWRTRVLGDGSVLKRAIVQGDNVVGNIISWDENGRRLLGYWIGQAHWGQGIATAALSEFLRDEPLRPVFAYAALHNHSSRSVLQKCGFLRVGLVELSVDGINEQLFRLDV